MVKMRDAIRADFDAVGGCVPFRARAMTMEASDGRIFGVGGVIRLDDGRLVAFANLTEEARSHPVALHKAAVRFMARLKQEGARGVIATADMAATPAAERWLARLGFAKAVYPGYGDVWIWGE